ncbi:ComEC/Rec2 family competence protein [Chamaesiphon minutus]|uniref:ComEC/Rec2-related protein n=1 Tax=Chamaesiphon minutus (strain ATCC 27169 / PCC 6605) TaxID=1173020 RepID=K9ULJ4_CHAP6|nr:ComEC/Rec2 family competence protein [Chamaesiphon minutus]AFY95538.1 ComEC/Rec2-related protein [Chamaesiphon minutus PCC 6605]
MRNTQAAIFLCLAYIIGLLITFNPWVRWGLIVIAIPMAWLLPRIWKKSPNWQFLLVAIAIAGCASFYLELRVPKPAANDISKYIPATAERGTSQFTIVRGSVDSYPHITRNQNAQFWLNATQLNEIQGDGIRPADVSKSVNGKVYVTVPLQSATGLQPGVDVSITGTLYIPQANPNPGGFSFRDYLSQSGGFTGMRGFQLRVTDETQTQKWSWGKLRQRIAAAQVKWLDVPIGPLVTAMVLGSDAVDLPFDLRDRFVRVGLAHALAASGFQVSLILNAILSLTRSRLSAVQQSNLGVVALLIFLGLTGFQPAVARSVAMGLAVLIGLRVNRKLDRLSSLFLAGTLLLIINPLWIWDIGFELSFLATLGLIVTVEPLQQKLDWLPPTIADLITVPLAASIWTLPIQLYVFKLFPLYSLPANILTSPLISIISIGGTIGALISAIFPLAGSAISWLLYLPTQLLIGIVDLFNYLPGTSFAVGQIAPWQLFALYGLILSVWIFPRFHKHWKLPLAAGILLVIVPLAIWKTSELQLTALAIKNSPNDRLYQGQILAIQDRGQTILINSGNESIARFVVLPFLQQQAINRIDNAIDFNRDLPGLNSWQTLNQTIPIKNFYSISGESNNTETTKFTSLPVGKAQKFGRVEITIVKTRPAIFQIEIPEAQQKWLVIGDDIADLAQPAIDFEQLTPAQTLYWHGGKIPDRAIAKINPQVAIAATSNPDPETIKLLERNRVRVYYTGRDGAIQWTPSGFKPYLEGEK